MVITYLKKNSFSLKKCYITKHLNTEYGQVFSCTRNNIKLLSEILNLIKISNFFPTHVTWYWILKKHTHTHTQTHMKSYLKVLGTWITKKKNKLAENEIISC